MIRPHPPRFLIKRRKTVSVTPAMGASTVAGAMRTFPIFRTAGNSVGTGSVGTGDSPVRATAASDGRLARPSHRCIRVVPELLHSLILRSFRGKVMAKIIPAKTKDKDGERRVKK